MVSDSLYARCYQRPVFAGRPVEVIGPWALLLKDISKCFIQWPPCNWRLYLSTCWWLAAIPNSGQLYWAPSVVNQPSSAVISHKAKPTPISLYYGKPVVFIELPNAYSCLCDCHLFHWFPESSLDCSVPYADHYPDALKVAWSRNADRSYWLFGANYHVVHSVCIHGLVSDGSWLRGFVLSEQAGRADNLARPTNIHFIFIDLPLARHISSSHYYW